jgi:hypothetical protein
MAITVKEAFDALREVDDKVDNMIERLGEEARFPASLQIVVRVKIERALSELPVSLVLDLDGEEKSYTFAELIEIYDEKRRALDAMKNDADAQQGEYGELLGEFDRFLAKIWTVDASLDLGERVENIIRTLVKARISRVISESAREPDQDQDEEPDSKDPAELLRDPEFLESQFVMVGPGYIVRGDRAGGIADRYAFDVGGQQMVVPRDAEDAVRFGMKPEDAAFFNNPLKGKEVFGLGEGDPENEVPNPLTEDMQRLPKLKPEMFPDVEDGGVIAEGKMQYVMGGIAPELGFDCSVLLGDDDKVYADHDLFRGFFDERVRLIRDGDGFKVEKI